MNKLLPACLGCLMFVALASTTASADDACPAPVKTTLEQKFPKSTITRCKAEREHGRDQFEVKLSKADGAKIEVDVSPDGKILQVEEKISVDKVPAAVTKAFGQRYPKAKLDAAEKQTPSEGAPTYELEFTTDKGRKEATFTEDGKFVEEE